MFKSISEVSCDAIFTTSHKNSSFSLSMPFLHDLNLLTFEITIFFLEPLKSYFLLVYEIYYLWSILLPYLLASVSHSGKAGRSATGTLKDNDVNDSSWCSCSSSQWKCEPCSRKQHVSWSAAPACSKCSLPGAKPDVYPGLFHKTVKYYTQLPTKEDICIFHKQDYST